MNTTHLREFVGVALDAIGFLLLAGGLFALCYATPNQLSGEADICEACIGASLRGEEAK